MEVLNLRLNRMKLRRKTKENKRMDSQVPIQEMVPVKVKDQDQVQIHNPMMKIHIRRTIKMIKMANRKHGKNKIQSLQKNHRKGINRNRLKIKPKMIANPKEVMEVLIQMEDSMKIISKTLILNSLLDRIKTKKKNKPEINIEIQEEEGEGEGVEEEVDMEEVIEDLEEEIVDLEEVIEDLGVEIVEEEVEEEEEEVEEVDLVEEIVALVEVIVDMEVVIVALVTEVEEEEEEAEEEVLVTETVDMEIGKEVMKIEITTLEIEIGTMDMPTKAMDREMDSRILIKAFKTKPN